MAYAKPQQRKEEESERLRGERDQIKFSDLRFERGQLQDSVGNVGERPIQSPNKGRKRKAKG